MILEIKALYGSLGDAVIEKIEYSLVSSNTNDKRLSVYMRCLNWRTEEWQKVKFDFINVLHFQYLKNKRFQSSVVFEALIEQKENSITIDFFPVQVDGLGKLAEDPESSFLVHCKTINYEVVG
jgi:hypothetical protein